MTWLEKAACSLSAVTAEDQHHNQDDVCSPQVGTVSKPLPGRKSVLHRSLLHSLGIERPVWLKKDQLYKALVKKASDSERALKEGLYTDQKQRLVNSFSTILKV